MRTDSIEVGGEYAYVSHGIAAEANYADRVTVIATRQDYETVDARSRYYRTKTAHNGVTIQWTNGRDEVRTETVHASKILTTWVGWELRQADKRAVEAAQQVRIDAHVAARRTAFAKANIVLKDGGSSELRSWEANSTKTISLTLHQLETLLASIDLNN